MDLDLFNRTLPPAPVITAPRGPAYPLFPCDR